MSESHPASSVPEERCEVLRRVYLSGTIEDVEPNRRTHIDTNIMKDRVAVIMRWITLPPLASNQTITTKFT